LPFTISSGELLDVIFGGADADALYGRGGDDFIFSDLQNLDLKSTPPTFELVTVNNGGDLVNGGLTGNKDVGVLLGLDFEGGGVDILSQNGATLSVLAWLRAIFVAADLNTTTKLFNDALAAFQAAGGMLDWADPVAPLAAAAEGPQLPDPEAAGAAEGPPADAAPPLPPAAAPADLPAPAAPPAAPPGEANLPDPADVEARSRKRTRSR
jgi:hypothetical protein